MPRHQAQAASWRDKLPIHPAADLFPLMSEAELKELAEDIKAHGLNTDIIIWSDEDDEDETEYLLDGRNRLDALALAGLLSVDEDGWLHIPDEHGWPQNVPRRYVEGDPYALAVSYNLHRRHLTAEQKRGVIAAVLKAAPEKSNRQIAEQLRVDHKTVASVRAEREATGDLPQLKRTVGKDGKSRTSNQPKEPAAKLTPDERKARQRAGREEAKQARANAKAYEDAREYERRAFKRDWDEMEQADHKKENTPIDVGACKTLVKALNQFGSDSDGIVNAAARQADRMLRELGVTWEELIRTWIESQPKRMLVGGDLKTELN